MKLQTSLKRAIPILVTCGLLLAGCGSKTYTVDKSIVYGNDIFNVSQVRQLSSNGVVMLPGGTERDILEIDRGEFNDLVEAHGPLKVSLVFSFDDRLLTYRKGTINNYSDFRALTRRWERAREDVQDFLADRKDTQLKLK